MKWESYQYDIPTWAIGTIFNGDYTGLSDEEENMINEFLEAEGILTWSFDEESKHFCPKPEFGLACDCYEVTGNKLIPSKYAIAILDEYRNVVDLVREDGKRKPELFDTLKEANDLCLSISPTVNAGGASGSAIVITEDLIDEDLIDEEQYV